VYAQGSGIEDSATAGFSNVNCTSPAMTAWIDWPPLL